MGIRTVRGAIDYAKQQGFSIANTTAVPLDIWDMPLNDEGEITEAVAVLDSINNKDLVPEDKAFVDFLRRSIALDEW